eukprot:5012118-Pyramimonas_sp.AAC.1
MCEIVSQLCDCGCSHWCSMYPVYQAMRWSLGALAPGHFPSVRHDGGAWRCTDAEREPLSGKAPRDQIGEGAFDPEFYGIVIDIKADWPEMATGCGVPAHSSGHAPCLLCPWNAERILSHEVGERLEVHPDDAYNRNCTSHEVWVFIPSADVHRKIRWKLEFKSSFRGRALVEDVRDVVPPLRRGDRLEA